VVVNSGGSEGGKKAVVFHGGLMGFTGGTMDISHQENGGLMVV
jgi:hypothetical protein